MAGSILTMIFHKVPAVVNTHSAEEILWALIPPLAWNGTILAVSWVELTEALFRIILLGLSVLFTVFKLCQCLRPKRVKLSDDKRTPRTPPPLSRMKLWVA